MLGGLLGGIIGRDASKAAGAQTGGLRQAETKLRNAYGEYSGMMQPYTQFGVPALNQYAQMLGLQSNVAPVNNKMFTDVLNQLFTGQKKGSSTRRELGYLYDTAKGLDPNQSVNQPLFQELLTRLGGGGIRGISNPNAFQGLAGKSPDTDSFKALLTQLAGTTTDPKAKLSYQAMLGTMPTNAPATGQAAPDYSAFYKSPAYQFRLDEGQKAIERSAAAKGGLLSGATMKGLAQYGQGVASDEYNAYLANLAKMMGFGAEAQQNIGQARLDFGQNLASNRTAAGQARASGYTNLGNVGRGLFNTAVGFLGAKSGASPSYQGMTGDRIPSGNLPYLGF